MKVWTYSIKYTDMNADEELTFKAYFTKVDAEIALLRELINDECYESELPFSTWLAIPATTYYELTSDCGYLIKMWEIEVS